MRRSALIIVSTLTLAFAVGSAAAEEKTGDRQNKRAKRQAAAVEKVFALPASIELNAEQQAKVATLKKQYASETADNQKELSEIATPEQRKAYRQSLKDARATGAKRKKVRQQALSELNLPEDKLQAFKRVLREQQQAQAKARQELRALLTPEQLTKLPVERQKKNNQKS